MRKHLAIAAIVAVLAVPGMRAAVAAGPQAGEVLALFGQCFVETAGRRDPLKRGDAVHVGNTVDVAAGAKLKLRMNDGSVIAAASGSRVTIAEYRVGDGGESRDATLSLGEGLLRAVVSPLGARRISRLTRRPALRLCARPTGSSKPSRGRRRSGCSRAASV